MRRSSARDVLRGAWRGCIFVLLLIAWILDFVVKRPSTLRERSSLRALWCKRVLSALHIELYVEGHVPTQGVLVGNHLSYLDILTFGAVFEGAFVAKLEVKSWPLIGTITTLADTIFVDRNRSRTLLRVIRQTQEALVQHVPVMFFPEGTTTDGSGVLPFYTAIFEAPVRSRAPIWSAGVSYTVEGSHGGVGDAVCYWGDMDFLQHLIQFLRLRNVRAVVHFADQPVFAADRRTAARLSRDVVVNLAASANTSHHHAGVVHSLRPHEPMRFSRAS